MKWKGTHEKESDKKIIGVKLEASLGLTCRLEE